MASMYQKVIYEGYLAADPIPAYTQNGKPVTNFRMGSTRKYKTSDGTEVKETTWLKITAWGKLGEIANEYLHKGSHVLVEGSLRAGENGSPNVYQLKSGDWAASYEITAGDIRILDKKQDTAEEDNSSSSDADEIPF